MALVGEERGENRVTPEQSEVWEVWEGEGKGHGERAAAGALLPRRGWGRLLLITGNWCVCCLTAMERACAGAWGPLR